MSYTVDWIAKSIFIPQSDLVFVEAGVYQLRLYNDFRKEIRRLEWEFTEGFWAPQVMTYNNPVTFSGITLASVIQIINGYTITFEDGAYDVLLREANSNVVDVTIRNQVRPIPFNSAGYTLVETGTSGLTAEESQALLDIASDQGLIQGDISTIQADIATIQVNIGSITSDVSSIESNITTINGNIGTMQGDLNHIDTLMTRQFARAMGLMQENFSIDQQNYIDYQGQKLLVSARMRLYNNRINVGTDQGIIATYKITSQWSGQENILYNVKRLSTTTTTTTT